MDTVIKLGKRDFKDLGWLDEYSEDQSSSVRYGQFTTVNIHPTTVSATTGFYSFFPVSSSVVDLRKIM